MKSTKSLHKHLLLGGIASLLFAATASATLTFDLRATQLNGVPVADGKNVIITQANDVITFALFADVTGTNALATEGFQTMLTGGVVSTANGGIRGTMEGPALSGNFGATGSAAGTLQDLNADGFTDLGSNNAAFVQGQHVTANAAAMEIGLPTGTSEFQLFTFQFRVVSIPTPGSSINVSFRMINVTGLGNELVWREDGVTKSTKDPITGFSTAGYTVNATALSVPEPSAFGMLALGALGLVGFRRMGLRRTA